MRKLRLGQVKFIVRKMAVINDGGNVGQTLTVCFDNTYGLMELYEWLQAYKGLVLWEST